MKTRLQPLENMKQQETCSRRFSKGAANITHEKLKCNLKIRKWVQLEPIIITRLIPREMATLNVQHWYAPWYSNPKTRLVESLAVFGEICIWGCQQDFLYSHQSFGISAIINNMFLKIAIGTFKVKNLNPTYNFKANVVESTLHPLNIVVTNIKILHSVFLGTYGHHIVDFFCSLQVYCISFRLKLVYLKRNSTKHIQIWTYEVFCIKINVKKCKYTSKLKLWMEFCSEFFCGDWYWYTSTKSRSIQRFFFIENKIKFGFFLYF
jgi:hypothetical protein